MIGNTVISQCLLFQCVQRSAEVFFDKLAGQIMPYVHSIMHFELEYLGGKRHRCSRLQQRLPTIMRLVDESVLHHLPYEPVFPSAAVFPFAQG